MSAITKTITKPKMASDHSLGSKTLWQRRSDPLFEIINQIPKEKEKEIDQLCEKNDQMPEKKRLLFVHFLVKLLMQEKRREKKRLKQQQRRARKRSAKADR